MYGIGAGVLGFIGWILGGVKDIIIDEGIHTTGNLFDLMQYIWTAMFIIYLVFGGWWMVRKYNEDQYMTGGMI